MALHDNRKAPYLPNPAAWPSSTRQLQVRTSLRVMMATTYVLSSRRKVSSCTNQPRFKSRPTHLLGLPSRNWPLASSGPLQILILHRKIDTSQTQKSFCLTCNEHRAMSLWFKLPSKPCRKYNDESETWYYYDIRSNRGCDPHGYDYKLGP